MNTNSLLILLTGLYSSSLNYLMTCKTKRCIYTFPFCHTSSFHPYSSNLISGANLSQFLNRTVCPHKAFLLIPRTQTKGLDTSKILPPYATQHTLEIYSKLLIKWLCRGFIICFGGSQDQH